MGLLYSLSVHEKQGFQKQYLNSDPVKLFTKVPKYFAKIDCIYQIQ